MRATHAERLATERSEVADEQTRIANAVNAFLQSILSAGDARNGGNPEITVREALDNAASTVGERFTGEPLVEAGIRRVIGDTYRSLGLPAEALEHLEASVALYRANAPETDPLRLQAVGDLAILYDDMNRKADAAALYAEDLRLRRVVDGPEAESTLVAEVNYAGVLLVAGDLEGAERAYASCLARMRESLGEENTNTIVTMQHLADLYTRLRRDDEAEALVAEAVAAWDAIGQGEHPYALVAVNNLAQLYGRTGRTAEALEMRTRAYDIATRTMGESHPTTMALLAMLAKSTAAQGRVEEALGMTDRAIASLEASVGREHLNTVQLLHERVELLRTMERFAEALEASAVSVEAARAVYPANDPKLAIGLSVRAEVLLALGRAEEAVPVLRETLEIYGASLGPEHEDTRRAASRLRSGACGAGAVGRGRGGGGVGGRLTRSGHSVERRRWTKSSAALMCPTSRLASSERYHLCSRTSQ
ncbi:MAG: tetratricopeptide repeat protein [Planctomycetota bacterium]|nr:MAG: tetratricopeptide repeat protein [Planctomycetota bacterium]